MYTHFLKFRGRVQSPCAEFHVARHIQLQAVQLTNNFRCTNLVLQLNRQPKISCVLIKEVTLLQGHRDKIDKDDLVLFSLQRRENCLRGAVARLHSQ